MNNEPNMTAANPSIQNPFRFLDLDAAKIDPVMAVNLYLEVTNALVYFTSLSNLNRSKLIDIGDNGGKKNEDYSRVNKERYDIDNKLEALQLKHKALEQVLYMKSAEMRHIDKARHVIG